MTPDKMESPELESHKADSPKEEPTIEVQTDELPVTQNIPFNKGISGKPSAEPHLGDEFQAQVPDPGQAYHTQVKMAPGIPVIWAVYTSEAKHVPLPGMHKPSAWSKSEKDMFLLALYIYGKRLHLVRRFLEGDNKTMGDVLSYYYGSFYKTDCYRRYKMKHCVAGPRLFQGWRQDKILSYLTESKPKESHDAIKEVFKSYNEERSSFEEFIIALRGVAGAHSLVQAISIGKGKHDLTKVRSDPTRGRNQGPTNLDMPVGKEWSLLSVEEVVRFLTGDFRLGKSRSNDLFWEAVWPRLLINGWIMVQPKDHALIFLIPGIDTFPREDLIKGIHYFDSVTDLLSKVASDPNLLSVPSNGADDDMNNNGNSSSSCLHPRLQINESGLMKFTVIDTSIVERNGVACKIRGLRSLPSDTSSTTHCLLYKTEVDRPAPERSGTVGSPNDSTDVVKDEPAESNVSRKIAKDTKPKHKNKLYVHDEATLRKRRRFGSSKIKTEAKENDQSSALCTDELTLKPHLLEPDEYEKKETSRASPSSVDLNLPDLTSTSDEYNEKEGTNSSNSRRHGTRNRPPTAKALESLALGFLGSTKRKDNEIKACSSRQKKRRSRKSVETVISGSHENVPMAACVPPCGCSDDPIDHA